jgi:hypothetical protein
VQEIRAPCLKMYTQSMNKSSCRVLIVGTDPDSQWIQPELIAEDLASHTADFHVHKLTVYGHMLQEKHPMLPFMHEITSLWQMASFIA